MHIPRFTCWVLLVTLCGSALIGTGFLTTRTLGFDWSTPRSWGPPVQRVAPPPPGPSDAEAYVALLTWYLGELKPGEEKVELAAKHLVADPSPAPTEFALHNSFAPKWRISKEGARPWPAKDAKEDDADRKYPLAFDVNLAELKQIQAEMKSKRLRTALTPMTRRQSVEPRQHGPALEQLAKAYGLKPAEYRPEYRAAWIDRSGNEYLLFAVTVKDRLRILIAGVRKAE